MRTLIALLLFFPLWTSAQSWQVDADQSQILITAGIYEGEPFVAEFTDFSTEISFDPQDLAAASVIATIQTGSFTAQNPDDEIYAFEATGADWFSVDAFPAATFTSQSFEALGEGLYRVSGTFEVKGETHPLSFDFNLRIEGEAAQMTAQFPLNRINLGLGTLTHPNDTTVKYEVLVNLEIVASLAE